MIDNYNQVSLWLWWLITSVIIIACRNPDSQSADNSKVAAARAGMDSAEGFENL